MATFRALIVKVGEERQIEDGIDRLAVGTGITTFSGNLTIDAAGTIAIVKNTQLTGSFTQSGGFFSLTGNAASSLSTTAGSLTLDGKTAVFIRVNGVLAMALTPGAIAMTGAVTANGSPVLTEVTHEPLNTLVHNLAESCFEEPAYDVQGKITALTVWQTAAKLKKVREELATYDGSGRIQVLTTTQFDEDGVAIVGQTITKTIARDGNGIIQNVTWVET